MTTDSFSAIAPLARLAPLVPHEAPESPSAGAGSGFGAVLNSLLDGNRKANAEADAAVHDLATGDAQDVHTVALAVAQADVSFRLILELRNRLADAFQEVTRMQV